MTPQQQTKRWLLARMSTIRAGMLLVVAQVDEIGISLSEDAMTPEMAALNLTALEQLPIYVAACSFTPDEAA